MIRLMLIGWFNLLFITQLQASPVIRLCVDENCHQLSAVKISATAWSEVTRLYDSPVQSDIDEQDNIAASIQILEQDIYQRVAEHQPELETADAAYSENSAHTNYRNIKRIIGLLMDHHLVNRHVLRNTLHERAWHGSMTIRGILLQSIETSDLYILSKDISSLQTAVEIIAYKDSKQQRFAIPSTQPNNQSADEEDSFE